MTFHYYFSIGELAEKSSVAECIFVYIALHSTRRFNKNTLLQCYLLSVFAGLRSYMVFGGLKIPKIRKRFFVINYVCCVKEVSLSFSSL